MAAFTGIGGAIYSCGCSMPERFRHGHLDHLHDLRYRCSGHLSSSSPLLCIRSTPEECGCYPTSAPQTASGKPAGLDAGKAIKSPSRLLRRVPAGCGIINLLTIVAQQFRNHTKSLGDGTGFMLAVGVTITTVAVASQAVWLALGVRDKNSRSTMAACTAPGIIGVLLVWFKHRFHHGPVRRRCRLQLLLR